MCAGPPKLPGQNTDPDPDGAAEHIFAESNTFNGDCSEGGSASLFVRDVIGLGYTHNWTELYYDEPHLDPRGPLTRRTRTSKRSDFLKYCVNNQQGYLIPQTYSGYRTVAGLANKGWIHIGKPLVCGAVGVVVSVTQPSGIDFVTEHVFEKQSLRNILQHMAAGTLPGGGTISIGAVPQGILSIGGVGFTFLPHPGPFRISKYAKGKAKTYNPLTVILPKLASQRGRWLRTIAHGHSPWCSWAYCQRWVIA